MIEDEVGLEVVYSDLDQRFVRRVYPVFVSDRPYMVMESLRGGMVYYWVAEYHAETEEERQHWRVWWCDGIDWLRTDKVLVSIFPGVDPTDMVGRFVKDRRLRVLRAPLH